ncbi:MAG: hypothetical protein ABIQ89_02095 [Candidatus Saccharimonadales bacterium]
MGDGIDGGSGGGWSEPLKAGEMTPELRTRLGELTGTEPDNIGEVNILDLASETGPEEFFGFMGMRTAFEVNHTDGATEDEEIDLELDEDAEVEDQSHLLATSTEISPDDMEKALDGTHLICVWENPDTLVVYKLCVLEEEVNTAADLNRHLLGTSGSFDIMKVEEMTSLKVLRDYYDPTERVVGGKIQG